MDKDILDGYNSPEGAEDYTGKFERHWIERINNTREQRLVRALLGNLPKSRLALDLPCGYGRMFPLVKSVSANVVEGDWSYFMLKEAQRRMARREESERPLGYVRATAFTLPFADRTFDLVFSVRLCHHIDEYDERMQYVHEILRISAHSVVFTYFDTDSVKNRVHRFKRRFTPRSPKCTLARQDIEKIAEVSGFEITRSLPLSRLFSGHRYTVLERR